MRADADPDIIDTYTHTLVRLACNDLDQGQLDAALIRVERAGQALESLVQDPRRLNSIVLLDSARRAIAGHFGRRGLKQQRRRQLEAHIRMLENSSNPGGGEPVIGLLAALSRADLAADGSAIATIRAAIQRFPDNRRLPELVKMQVGGLDRWRRQPVSLRSEPHERTDGPTRPGCSR